MTERCKNAAVIGGLLLAITPLACSGERVRLDTLTAPDGFRVEVFAEAVEGARSLALGAEGTVFVGSRDAGRVYALVDADGDDRAERVVVIAEGLNSPNGVAFRDGDLYVAEIDRILRFTDIESRLDDPPEVEVVSDAYPSDTHHGWKFIAFGPDGHLYVPIGAPCNICDEEGYARITRLDTGSGAIETFASGVRNTVGFDWHPETGDLWFTDNGRDWLGDDAPPDELNRAPGPGLHFGYPFCHGETIQDPEFTGRDCDEFVPPAQPLGAHVAGLGMRFYTGTMFPETYHQRIFIAEHGSWNRSSKVGYRITTVTLDEDRAVAYEPFIEGWLQPGGDAWGRPVDVMVMPDGAMLVSDDRVGAVYRVSWQSD